MSDNDQATGGLPQDPSLLQAVETVDEIIQQEMLDKYDNDSTADTVRTDWIGRITSVIAGIMSIYVIFTAGFGTPEALLHRSTFMLMCLPLAFWVYPARKKYKGMAPKWYDYIFFTTSVLLCGYMMVQHNDIIARSGMATPLEQVLFLVALVLILEAVRRLAGMGMVIIIGFFLLYSYLGKFMPGILAHPGLSLRRMSSYLLLTSEGLFGSTVGTVAGMVGLFIIFASFMEKTGVGKFINDFALSLTGASAGGPAKVSVVTSALFGTISGNAVSNVVTTGAFTIPLMKRTGYSNEFSGAVEAVASTAGQLMPPVMGASAFLMADITGIPYSQICLAAVVPVLLYYIGCFTMVHLRAKKTNLHGLSKDQIPHTLQVVKKDGYLFIPFIFVVVLLMMRYTITFVGFWAIPLSIAIAAIRKDTRMSLRDIWDVLTLAGRRLISLGGICAGISIIMAVCNLTGITTTLSNVIIKLAGGNFVFTILLIAVVCIVMGMGLPTVSVYLLLSTVAAPALILGFDVPILAAHMYVFYFGLLANVTPPVAIPAYAAAGLAGGNPSKTGWQAFLLALGGFLVPFIFIFSPDILFIDATLATIPKILTAIVGVFILSTAVEGWLITNMPVWQRVVMAAAAILMVIPETITDIVGIIVAVGMVLHQVAMKKRQDLISAS